MRTDNLSNNSAEMRDIIRRLRNLETASPLAHASITRGRLRIGGTGTLLVDSEGGAVIEGTLSVTGTETVDGTLQVDGTETVNGQLNVNGPTSLKGNLAISGGGKITAGGMTLSPTAGSGYPGLGSSGSLGIQAAASIGIEAPSILVNGLFSTTSLACSLPDTTTEAANVHCSPYTGVFSLVSSAARYKLDAQPMKLPDALLDVPVKDWIDKGQHERGEDTHRIPGVIAEEVEAAGGAQFVTYGAEGVIEGVSYDRLALARTEILARKLEAAMHRIEELERRADAAHQSLRSR